MELNHRHTDFQSAARQSYCEIEVARIIALPIAYSIALPLLRFTPLINLYVLKVCFSESPPVGLGRCAKLFILTRSGHRLFLKAVIHVAIKTFGAHHLPWLATLRPALAGRPPFLRLGVFR